MAIIVANQRKRAKKVRAKREFPYWPARFYGPEGQVQLFHRPDEVPEGWHDDPKKFNDPKAKTVIPGLKEALASQSLEGESKSDVPELPDYDDITATGIKEMLDELGVPYDTNDKRELYKLLSGEIERLGLEEEEEGE